MFYKHLEANVGLLPTWFSMGINPAMIIHSERMYLPQGIPVLAVVLDPQDGLLLHSSFYYLSTLDTNCVFDSEHKFIMGLLAIAKLTSLILSSLFPRNKCSRKLFWRELIYLGILFHDPRVTGPFIAEGSYDECHW